MPIVILDISDEELAGYRKLISDAKLSQDIFQIPVPLLDKLEEALDDAEQSEA